MKILLSGGWTLGGVTPLLALAEAMKEGNEFLWIGTTGGPERVVVSAAGMRFVAISSGKIRRYASVQNIVDVFRVGLGSIQSFFILLRERPDVHVTAGGFVSVPVAVAGWVLGVPLVVHQEDISPLRANMLMSRVAAAVTVTVAEAGVRFARFHPIVVGNPVRRALRSAAEGDRDAVFAARERLGLDPHRPTVVVLGGGIGALPINERIAAVLPQLLPHMQIFHVAGKGKEVRGSEGGYHVIEFVTAGMEDLYLAADLVVSRAGFGTLTELAVFKRAAVLIPLPRSAQIENAEFCVSHSAAEMLKEAAATPELLSRVILQLMRDAEQRQLFGENLRALFGDGDPSRLAGVVAGVAKTNKK